tara:strand:- start:3784 stop:3912 length:129 start_codon:yes stop_codon:yes gene_type:complete
MKNKQWGLCSCWLDVGQCLCVHEVKEIEEKKTIVEINTIKKI